MISYQEAITLITKVAERLRSTESVLLAQALGRTLATDVVSTINLPNFCNSAMDGFAVRHAQLSTGKDFTIGAMIAAGDGFAVAQEVPRIMTGAPVPDGYDTVIPVEAATVTGDKVSFTVDAEGISKGANIRTVGEDVMAGDTVLTAGQRLNAEKITLLAALGVANVEVFSAPKVFITSTGNELVTPGESLEAGKIYNSNAYYLAAKVAQQGLVCEQAELMGDKPERFEAWLQQLPANSIVISSGAVSKGDLDFIPHSLARVGATVHLHRVGIRPGKPVLCATLANGSLFFGLPGNPISVAVGWSFFVSRALAVLQGRTPQGGVMARLAEDFTKKNRLRQFLKARLTVTPEGALTAEVLPGQESFKILPLSYANAWLMLPEESTKYAAGTLVEVYPFTDIV